MNAPALDLFLCGDVMTGRGIDQLLPQPARPTLYEGYVTDARDYVRLAEVANGPIARPVGRGYVWGEALAEIDRRSPRLRIVNLETAVTTAEDAWPGKGIHYRMHPANVGCLTAAHIDACVLANNHVLDWGGNWGYAIGRDERAFAQALVEAGTDLVHGHSSHHARGFEVYRERLVLYGCGDFINDYEGIGGHESYRGDLAGAYFVRLVEGRLRELTLVPFRSRRLSLRRAAAADAQWLLDTLNRECRPFGARLALAADGSLGLADVG